MNTKRKVIKSYVAPVTRDVRKIEEYRLSPRRLLTKGDEFQVSGERGGRFEFLHAEVLPSGITQVACVGGRSGHRMMRTFMPDRITKVHRRTQ